MDESLSKKDYYWEHADEVIKLAKKYQRPFIGFGTWINKPENYCVLTEPNGHIMWIMKSWIKDIGKWVEK